MVALKNIQPEQVLSLAGQVTAHPISDHHGRISAAAYSKIQQSLAAWYAVSQNSEKGSP